MAGRWRLDKRQLEACVRGRCRRGVSWRRSACVSAPALAGGVRVGAGDVWRRACGVGVGAALAGGVPRACRRRRWLVACASAPTLAGGVRVGAGDVWRRAGRRGVSWRCAVVRVGCALTE
ncbi:hypothetical protein GUJ93_ZPchr0010g10544 [Zizania palustris]|uniref:Uncharacterized protein n=1 Tax=Zizania palustris TaxID=103762 RepID=A0A8J6BHI6_ZIZPA|nr:hypothetical protein GUJ93_ZPchr0010g10544 [Zizania palustris]